MTEGTNRKQYFECHGHTLMDGVRFAAARDRHLPHPDEAVVRAHLAALRDAGVMYFRDGGDAQGVSLLARDLAPEYGIEYVSPAFAIHRAGRYGNIVGRSYENAAEFRQRVLEAKEAGADFIKFIISGIITFKSYGELSCPPLPKEEIREMIGIAHEEGFSVMIHGNGDEAVRAAAEAGAESIEHCNFLREETLHCLAESGTLIVPTLAAVEAFIGRQGFAEGVAERTLDRQMQTLADLRSMAPGKIASGSDSGAVGVPHGAGTLREYELLRAAGIPEEEILAANERIRNTFSGKRRGVQS